MFQEKKSYQKVETFSGKKIIHLFNLHLLQKVKELDW